PLPFVPLNEIFNVTANDTIEAHPDLFPIITPIKAGVLRRLLIEHPNQPFVQSVCRGYEEGFWPWADTSIVPLPTTLDVKNQFCEAEHVDFVRSQRDIEIEHNCFSKGFPHLLPGMMVVPIVVSTKARSGKLRMCVNHSAEPFARNMMIPKSVVSVPLDNLHDLGCVLRELRVLFGHDIGLNVWKCDAARTHRNQPMDPHWQIKQIVKIDNRYHVDRASNFGSRASGGLWGSFCSLVLWIARHRNIRDVFAYADDCFSVELATSMSYYIPYNKLMPTSQCRFLELFDELGIPHEEKKQVFGEELMVIGFVVNCRSMSITMPADSRCDLISAIRAFAVPGRRPKLSDYQRLAGWINWSLNVFPLLRPGLSALYAKIKGKNQQYREIYVNKQVCGELLWVANHMESLPGIFMVDSVDWSLAHADLTILCDASPLAMGFWIPSLFLGFQSAFQNDGSLPIFFWEALSVLSALTWAVERSFPPPRRLLIFTDNSNTVSMFNSLRATSTYNPILLTACDLLIKYSTSLRVCHISGKDNDIADALSRLENDRALAACPTLSINQFLPPRLMMG
ncbi:hypothetical protein GALMADRAFT_18481, partial [Galerina marginata CBS 339.88]